MIPLKLVEKLVNRDRVNAAFSFFASRPLQATLLHKIQPLICKLDQYLIIHGMNDAASEYADITLSLESELNPSFEGWEEFCSWVAKNYGAIQTGSIVFNRPFCEHNTIPILEEASRSIESPNELVALLAISQFVNQNSDLINAIPGTLLANSNTQIHILRALAEWSSNMTPGDSPLNKQIPPLVFNSIRNQHHFASAVIVMEKLSAHTALRFDLACLAIDSFERLGLDAQTADYLHNYIIRYLDNQQLEILRRTLSDKAGPECPFSVSLLQSIAAWEHIRINDSTHIYPGILTVSQYLCELSDYLYSPSPGDSKSSFSGCQAIKDVVDNKSSSERDIELAVSDIAKKIAGLRPE